MSATVRRRRRHLRTNPHGTGGWTGGMKILFSCHVSPLKTLGMFVAAGTGHTTCIKDNIGDRQTDTGRTRARSRTRWPVRDKSDRLGLLTRPERRQGIIAVFAHFLWVFGPAGSGHARSRSQHFLEVLDRPAYRCLEISPPPIGRNATSKAEAGFFASKIHGTNASTR